MSFVPFSNFKKFVDLYNAVLCWLNAYDINTSCFN